MKAEEITSQNIEQALLESGDKFTAASVVKKLVSGNSAPLRRRVERAIESDGSYFYDDKWSCCTRQSFFNGKTFLVTPDKWEISQGVLFPGHRFVPFVPETIFPSTVKLIAGNGQEIGQKKMISPLGTVFHYHILLGSEQIFDFMLADDPANESLAHGAGKTDSITLSVYDLQKFYQEHDFAFGDALLCTVRDYAAGEISFEYLSRNKRPESSREKAIVALDDSAEIVWDKFQDYLDIPEQLAWIMYFLKSGKNAPGVSLDEFIAGSEKVQLRPEGDHAVLTIAGADDDFHEHHHDCGCGHDHDDHGILPEGLSLSSDGEGDPLKLLSEAGFPLTQVEVDGFMLDAIYGRESDFDGVRSRIFGHAEFDFEDEVKQAILLNYLEERFENLQENYNRADDEIKADLRSQIMEAVQHRLDYLAMLGGLDHDPGESEQEKMRELADVAIKLGEVLRLLNHPGFTPDQRELDRIGELIDEQISRQEEIIGDGDAAQ
jgi:hypothetical protein